MSKRQLKLKRRETIKKAIKSLRGTVTYGDFGKKVRVHPRALAAILKSIGNERGFKRYTSKVVSKAA